MARTLPFRLRIDEGGSGSLALKPLRQAEAGRLRWKVVLVAGEQGFRGACSLVLPLPGAGDPPWFLIPGFFYGQGRTDPRLRYPALGYTSDGWTSSAWDFALDRAAYPVVLAHSEGRWFGLDAGPHYQVRGAPDHRGTWGDSETQIGLGFTWISGRGELRINLPANERPRRHARNPRDGATKKVLDLPPGARIECDLGLWEFAGDAHGYQQVLVRLYGELRAGHPPGALPPHRELADCAAHGLKAWHWTPPAGDLPGYMVYTAAMDRSVEFNANVNRGTSLGWHFESLGFVGGFPVAFGLMWQGLRRQDAVSCDIARQLADRYCRDGLAANGLFRTSYHPGKARTRHGQYANGSETPAYGSCWLGDPALAHARTTADASFHLARLCALVGAGDPSYPAWRAALRRSLETALRLQRADGWHAQIYDLAADGVRQWDGCGGMLWIAAMDAAHGLFADDAAFQGRLLTAMSAAGAAYAGDVAREYLYGAPEDVSLAPTSEDGYNAIMAYGRLHRRSGSDRDLALLRQAADWTLTWRKAYNVRFDRRNILGAADFRTCGGDFASSNNNHLHVYGLNCLAELHRLSELCDDPYYRQRADDNLAFVSQQLCLVDGQWNGQRGMLTEQFYSNDWSIWDAWDPGPDHVQKGSIMGFSHVWCINMLLLGLEELERAGRLEALVRPGVET